jgi:hypothetical protein
VSELGLNRRELLAGGGVLLVAGALPAFPAAAASSALAPARTRTFRALVASVLRSPSMRVDPGEAGEVTRRFARRYREMEPSLRRQVDAALDAVEDAVSGRPLSRMAPAARSERLHATAAAADERSVAVGQALALVASVVGPDDGHEVVTL